MPKIKVNGINIHYLQLGQGSEDIVMVHGLAANLAFWYMKIAPLLAKDYKITVFDLRGHGLSEMPDSGYTTRDMAEDLSCLIDEIGIKKAHLVGHSLGGAICLHHVILHPGQVKTLTLADCRIHALQPFRSPEESSYWQKRREELLKKGIFLTSDTPKVIYSMLEELEPLTASGQISQKLIPGLLASNSTWDTKSRAALRWKKLVSTTSFPDDIRELASITKEKIQKIAHHILLAYGENSTCLETYRALKENLTDCKTVVYPGMGHFFPVVEPELFVKDLSKFLIDFNQQTSKSNHKDHEKALAAI
jgi:pimeloyl-ACP methyl ester carboxylesterase